MANFAENLLSLPSVAAIERIELYCEDAQTPAAIIENKPGQAGSLALYCHLAKNGGEIDSRAAALGLELYAEHTGDARLNPGKHPNIDRLFAVVAENLVFKTRIVAARGN